MKRIISLALVSALFPMLSNAQSPQFDNSPVKSFDLSRYLGTWYEIARFDHSFERGMENVTAEYSLKDDGTVKVLNSGLKKGKPKVAEGKARQPDPKGNPAHLEVSFFLFFYSDYNILMLDDLYHVALVGSSSPDYLWIKPPDEDTTSPDSFGWIRVKISDDFLITLRHEAFRTKDWRTCCRRKGVRSRKFP